MKNFLRKTKKFIFKKFLLAGVNEKYINMPAAKVSLCPIKSDFLLIAPVFNDAELIKLQYHSLKKLTDQYDYIVVDDSSDSAEAKAIESFCVGNGVSYVHLPENNPGLDGSLCHGLALNWAFYNLVKKIKPERFGFLDPDLFVVKPGSFLEPWKSESFWGVRSSDGNGEMSGIWRLWPGFCFFKRDFYEGKNLNFLPTRNLDTGGGNFRFLKDFDDDHLIKVENAKGSVVLGEEKTPIGVFANVMHLVGSRFNSEEVIKKKEFARNAIFGDQQ